MKHATIVWNLLLAVTTVVILGPFVPKVYQQARYQFADLNGRSSMWPATFEGFLTIAAILACVAGLSCLFNRRLGAVSRTVSGLAAGILFGSWIYCGVLWEHYAAARGYKHSIASVMLFDFDGALFMVVALISLFIATTAGRGPLALLGEHLRKKRSKKSEDASQRE
jgi:hypothetical protein